MNLFPTLFLASALLALAACERSAPQVSGNRQVATSPVETKVVSENGMLTVDPAIIDLCEKPEGIVASDVSWNANSAGTEGVEIWLQGADGTKTLWSASGAVFASRTGTWMSDGSEVIMVDGENDQELARIRIKAKPCAK